MAFPAKFAAPAPAQLDYIPPVLARALEGGITLFHAPPGTLPTSQISTALAQRSAPILWLRIGPEDRDPGVLLTDLIEASAKLRPGTGNSVLQHMRQRPGPVNGWEILYTLLAQELQPVLSHGSAVIIEHMQLIMPPSPTWTLLVNYFLMLLPAATTRILVSHEAVRRDLLPLATVQQSPQDLRLQEQGALAMARMHGSLLDDSDILRLRALTQGRQALIGQVFNACSPLEKSYAHKIIHSSRNEDDLLSRLIRALITSLPEETSRKAILALKLGYFRKDDSQMPVPPPSAQLLNEGWARVFCSWHHPLRSLLLTGQVLPRVLREGAEELLRAGDTNGAVGLYLEAGEVELAAEALSGAAYSMLDLGQWQTLKSWIDRIPEKVLNDWPWLVFARGEMEAARRDLPAARRSFEAAGESFRRGSEPVGACLCYLTESTLALWQGNRAIALNLALSAQIAARGAAHPVYQAYAAWQIGCLYAIEALYETALPYFQEVERLAVTASDAPMTQLSRYAVELIQNEQKIHQQEKAYRQAYEAAEQSHQDTVNNIHKLITSPAWNLGSILAERGWSQTPVNLKLPPAPKSVANGEERPGSFWQALLGVFGLAQPSPAAPTRPLDASPPAVAEKPPEMAVSPALVLVPTTGATVIEPGVENVEPAPQETVLTISAWMLGDFRVTINDQPVAGWAGGRGRAVFQYLLANHLRARSREALMDIFWQDAAPEPARNRLNVALHSLRQSLRNATSLPVVLFQDGAYHLNPDFSLWLDVDDFECHARAAQEAERAGAESTVVDRCERAIQLYQDDFLSSDPYEEWAVLPRERLRILYMDTLDRLSRTYFRQGQYPACVRLCQKILERDRCREDAHTRLMQCYIQQGEYPMALRQFQSCVEALKADLGVDPSPSTLQLAEKIRRRDAT